MNQTSYDVLRAAAQAAELDASGAELIRDGSNVMYRLPSGVVARIGRPGSQHTAEREIQAATWLADAEIPAVEAMAGVSQAIVVDNRPVTWWKDLPEHRAATPAELGAVLSALHALPIPAELHLPEFDPFAGLEQRINEAAGFADDRTWLREHLDQLRVQYQQQFSTDRTRRVIHGDAWQGNVATPESGPPVVLDLEHMSVGHVEWDLAQIAVDYTDFARIGIEEYQEFVAAYGGYDVTTARDYRTVANIQELRWVCFVLSKSQASEDATAEACHRIACLKSEVPRPWTWTAF